MDERENTKEVVFTTRENYDWGAVVGMFMFDLWNTFGGSGVQGKFKVTIEFYPDGEENEQAS